MPAGSQISMLSHQQLLSVETTRYIISAARKTMDRRPRNYTRERKASSYNTQILKYVNFCSKRINYYLIYVVNTQCTHLRVRRIILVEQWRKIIVPNQTISMLQQPNKYLAIYSHNAIKHCLITSRIGHLLMDHLRHISSYMSIKKTSSYINQCIDTRSISL